jgi:hypothetical protein
MVFDLVDVLFGVRSLCRSTLLSYRVLFLRNNTKAFEGRLLHLFLLKD